MSTSSIIFIGVGVYIAIMLAVGVYASRRVNSVVEFAVAGRSLPLWICATTIVATWFGGGMMMGGSGAAYDDGMLGVIADPFGAAVCLFLVALFFARIIRRLKILTFVEFIEQRFGRVCAMIAAVVSMISSMMWTAGMLVAFGIIFESLTGTPIVTGILGGAFIVVVYTAIGGMFAVAYTDFVQMLIIAIGLIVLLIVVLINVGGWGAITQQLPEDTWRMLPLEHTAEQWLNYIRAWFIFGLADIGSQSLMQRAASARSERVATNAFYVAGFAYIGFGMIPVLLGIIGSVVMPDLANSESILPAMALEFLHPVAVAIFVGALLAAIMSSADSTLLSVATILGTNILPIFRPEPSDRMRIITARVGIVVGGIVSVLMALYAMQVFETALDANLLALAAVIVPFIMGLWWKKANRTGALSAMVAGIVVWLLSSYVYPDLPGDLIGLGASLLTMLIVTPLTQKFDPPRPLLDTDGVPVDLDNRLGLIWGRERKKAS